MLHELTDKGGKVRKNMWGVGSGQWSREGKAGAGVCTDEHIPSSTRLCLAAGVGVEGSTSQRCAPCSKREPQSVFHHLPPVMSWGATWRLTPQHGVSPNKQTEEYYSAECWWCQDWHKQKPRRTTAEIG